MEDDGQRSDRRLAVVTGASSGIGLELAKVFADNAFDLVIAAEDDLEPAAAELRGRGATVDPVRADLGTNEGVEALADRVGTGNAIDALAINAGVGVGGPFLDTALGRHLALIALNVTGAVHLAHRLLPAMVGRGEGRVLFTSSIAGTMPAPYESTYGASKAFLSSFGLALRHELADSGVTVTVLMPGPTETEFFDRAGLEDTKVGQSSKDDPATVAAEGFEAMMAGKDHIVTGSLKNKLQAGAAKVLPDKVSAAGHASMSEPGSGKA
jgi:short-subunit dehydrogenase